MIPLNRKPCGIAALFGALLPAALGAGGCARVSTVSEVRPDGSMTRTVTYKGTAPAAPRETAAGGETPVSESSEMSISPRLEELIALPSGAAGSGWTVTRTRDDRSNVVVTATRTVAAGQALHNDLGIRMPKPKPAGPPGKSTIAAPAPMPAKVRPLPALLLENTATVRTITPGKLEYRETLHWRGPRPTEIDTPDPGMLAALRRSLPPSVTDDAASLKQVGITLQRDMWRLMFGPGDPLMPLLAFHQDLAEYRIRKQLKGAVRRSLTMVYGARLSAEELDTAVQRMSGEIAADATRRSQMRKDAAPGGGIGGASAGVEDTQPIALLIRVKLPGRVIATNGELDADTNEVSWALYSTAAAPGDLALTATTDVSSPAPK